MTIDLVRDLCRSAQEALDRFVLQGPPAASAADGAAALALAAQAVAVAMSSVGYGSFPHIQAMVTDGLIKTELHGKQAAQDLFEESAQLARTLYGQDPERALHLLGKIAVWYWQEGDQNRACELLSLLLEFTERTFGPDHPRYLVLRSQGLRWLSSPDGRPLGLWHF